MARPSSVSKAARIMRKNRARSQPRARASGLRQWRSTVARRLSRGDAMCWVPLLGCPDGHRLAPGGGCRRTTGGGPAGGSAARTKAVSEFKFAGGEGQVEGVAPHPLGPPAAAPLVLGDYALVVLQADQRAGRPDIAGDPPWPGGEFQGRLRPGAGEQ